MSVESFKIRHATMMKGIRYPEKYQPYQKCEGYVSYFSWGVHGLVKFSDPKHVMAIYISRCNIRDHTTPTEYEAVKCDQYGNFWPMSEEAYADLLKEDL
jgi:hypothetical protein